MLVVVCTTVASPAGVDSSTEEPLLAKEVLAVNVNVEVVIEAAPSTSVRFSGSTDACISPTSVAAGDTEEEDTMELVPVSSDVDVVEVTVDVVDEDVVEVTVELVVDVVLVKLVFVVDEVNVEVDVVLVVVVVLLVVEDVVLVVVVDVVLELVVVAVVLVVVVTFVVEVVPVDVVLVDVVLVVVRVVEVVVVTVVVGGPTLLMNRDGSIFASPPAGTKKRERVPFTVKRSETMPPLMAQPPPGAASRSKLVMSNIEMPGPARVLPDK